MSEILFRYTGIPLNYTFGNFTGHSGKWCWWAIGNVMMKLGHTLTPWNWNDEFVPSDSAYDGIFSIQHLDGLEGAYNDNTVKIMRLTASDIYHHNNMVKERVAQTNRRRRADLSVRRLLVKREDHYKSFELADYILMNGNRNNMRTYPEKYWNKIVTMNTCASNIGNEVVVRNYIPEKRAFLFHAGSGAVHKGLDLCLEVFAKHPEWTLHITSDLGGEQEFINEYEEELMLPNVYFHGWMVVQSEDFQNILKDCYAFIMPSCSEGQSPSVATCLTLGLYPIISKWTGIDLPDGCGIYIEDLTVDAVEDAILNMPDDEELLRQVDILQHDAVIRYGKQKFIDTITGYLEKWLK